MSHAAIDKSLPVKLVERLLFNVRWVLPIFYLGLVVILGLYGYAFAKEIWHVLGEAGDMTMDKAKVIALDFVDVVMIANLVKMIVTGSYHSFISKLHGYPGENVSSGMLKVKIASSVVVVMMIHLLRTFTEGAPDAEALSQKLTIFGAVSTVMLVLACIEYLHIKGEVLEHTPNENHSHPVAPLPHATLTSVREWLHTHRPDIKDTHQ